MKRIYLDANGSSPPLPAAREKIAQMITLTGNPSSSHEHGRVMRTHLDEARTHVAHALEAKPKEIIFTSGASESNRLFVDALAGLAKKREGPLTILMSPYEHPSLYKPIFADTINFAVSIIPVDNNGALAMTAALCENVDVLIVCHAHNETGIVNDVDAIASMVADDVLIMSDVSQAFSRLAPLSLRVDVMSFSAQKMGGFAGVGGLLVRGNGKKLSPPWQGGGQERGFRPGTESVLLIAAFGEAARLVDKTREQVSRLARLRDKLECALSDMVPLNVIGAKTMRLANTTAISFYVEDPDALRIACDLAGLSVGFGAACSGLAPEGSFALRRLGLSTSEERTTVRFSLPVDCDDDEVDETLQRLLMFLSRKSLA